MLVCKTDQ